MLQLVTSMSRQMKSLVLLAVDVALVPLALVLAFALQQNGLPEAGPERHWAVLPLLMMIAGLLVLVTGVHRIQLKAYESRAIMLTGVHALMLGLATAILDDLAGYGTPLATFINFVLVYFLMSVAARVMMLQVLIWIYRQGQAPSRALIYGAGRTGRQLVAALRTDETIQAVAFVDDAPGLQGTIVRGLNVYSPVTVEALVKSRKVDRVLLAMPSLSRPRLARLARRFEDMGLDVQSVPSFAQLTGQETLVGQLERVAPGKFLGRAALDSELPGVSGTYLGKRILITGAGGSIGSELCRQVLACKPAALVLYEVSELALFTIEMELRRAAKRLGVPVVPVLGSVCDEGAVARVLAENEVQIVLHAAAYKHVPLVERNPVAGMANNVLGTQVLASAAAAAGVERFTLISTDKAVRPKNMMGASKRLAELVVQDLAARSGGRTGGTLFSMVRFGNVMGSSGSVIPLFEEQIARGGPVTLTHNDVARYFMTISEASQLIMQAAVLGGGGEIYVLDMGEPVKIAYLAEQLIRLSGKVPGKDIQIVYTGLRPGEKLFEELFHELEPYEKTTHEKIFLAHPRRADWEELRSDLRSAELAVRRYDTGVLQRTLLRLVPELARSPGNDAASDVVPITRAR